MSFILDALKKLERQKQQEENASGGGETVMEGGRRWGQSKRRIDVGKSVVVVALLALVIAGFALYQSSSVEKPELPAASEAQDVPAQEERHDVTAPLVRGQVTAQTSSEPSGKASLASSSPVVPAEEPETVEETEAGLDTEEEPDASEPPAEEGVETAPPVRLVGRTHENPPDEKVDPAPADTAPSELVGEAVEGIPEGLPELVLQGTSVVDGRPIAVINYQRLFEGDSIEGARILKILDRVVELEYEGKRFVIKL
jgi:hypothetical protein